MYYVVKGSVVMLKHVSMVVCKHYDIFKLSKYVTRKYLRVFLIIILNFDIARRYDMAPKCELF